MVWAQNITNGTNKHDPTRHGTRREKKRQTEEEMGSNITEWTRLKSGEALRKAGSRDSHKTVTNWN